MRALPVILMLGLFVGGCDGGDDKTDTAETDTTETDPVETDTTETDDGETDVTATCSGADLCDRTLGECGVTTITLEQCLDFYDPATTTCADIEAYETCNCDCIGEATCSDYDACGSICFSDHC